MDLEGKSGNPLDDHDWLDGEPAAPDQQVTPNPEEIEEEKSGCRRVVMIIIIILIILLLLWPVDKSTRKRIDRARRKAIEAPAGERTIGQTAYRIISAEPIYNLRGVSPYLKTTPVKVVFTVRNLSYTTRNLGYSAVKLLDENGNPYEIHPRWTQEHYKRLKSEIPWEQDIGAGRRKSVEAVFSVFKGPVKSFRLAGRDLDWQAVKFEELPLGKLSTLPAAK